MLQKKIKSLFEIWNNIKTDSPFTIDAKLFFFHTKFDTITRQENVELRTGCPNLWHSTLAPLQSIVSVPLFLFTVSSSLPFQLPPLNSCYKWLPYLWTNCPCFELRMLYNIRNDTKIKWLHRMCFYVCIRKFSLRFFQLPISKDCDLQVLNVLGFFLGGGGEAIDMGKKVFFLWRVLWGCAKYYEF
jgi:hypothetical protein